MRSKFSLSEFGLDTSRIVPCACATAALLATRWRGSLDEKLRKASKSDDPARLAIEERRAGLGIANCEPEILAHVLVSPWVSTMEWAAIRTGFKSIVIVRPGRLNQVPGYRAWMSRTLAGTATWNPKALAIVGRTNVKSEHVADVQFAFLTTLHRWLGSNLTTKYKDESLVEHVLHRTKETWSIEHVRLHCGMDPVEPAPRGLVSTEPTRVGTCASCRSVEGRMRSNGRVLCYGCNKRRS